MCKIPEEAWLTKAGFCLVQKTQGAIDNGEPLVPETESVNTLFNPHVQYRFTESLKKSEKINLI
jgi:hypothetical protein